MSYHHVNKKYDIAVVGGGLSGICAALAAARQGAHTALIQARSMYGGNASSEVRMHIVGANCHMSKPNVSEGGILMELLLANKARNPEHEFSVWDGILWEKVRFEERLDSYLNTCMDEVFMKGDCVAGILCHQNTTETEYEIEADIFIDATGHGTLGAMAGASWRMGSESRSMYGEPGAPDLENSDTMGNTLMFHASDAGHPVPFERPFWAYEFNEDHLKYRQHYDCVSALRDDGGIIEFVEGNSENLPQFTDMDSGYWWIELGGQYDDIIAEGETIRDELLRCVYGVWDHIKNCGDHGADNYVLDWVGMVPGSRESRRLMGDYVLTEQDIRSNRIFPDAVAYGGWPMDEHVRCGILDFDKHPSKVLNFSGIYTIPYRCYYSKDIANLMMAGRDISVSKMAFGSTRVMGTCAVGGQAVGTAAALAIRRKCTPRQVGEHIEELQQILLREDSWIPGYTNLDQMDLARKASVTASGSREGYTPEAVVKGESRCWNGMENCWESLAIEEGGAAEITLTLDKEVPIREVRLVFDPNMSRELMPSMTNSVKKRQVPGMPEELVRDYTVMLSGKGHVVQSLSVKDNRQRLCQLKFEDPVMADQVTVRVNKTYGYPAARIFEIRLL